MTQGPETGGYHTSEDEHILHKLGYAQELFRGDGRVSELRDQLHDHLDPRGVPDLVQHRLRARRPDVGGLRLAARRPHGDDHLPRHGGDRLRLSDRRRSLLLGVEARQPGLGLGDGVVQPHRPGRGHRGDRLRARALRAGALRLLVLVHGAHERLVRRVVRCLDVHPLRALPVGGSPDQPAEHPPDVRAEHDLGLVAHGRRRRDRRDPDHRPERPPVALVRVHADHQQLGLRRRNDPVRARVPARARAGDAAPAVHDHRVRRVGAHRRGDQQRVPDGGDGDVDLRCRLRDLRLDPARRGDVRDPEQPGGARHGQRPRASRALDLGRVDGPELGGGAALHLRRRAVLLRDRVRDLGVADDVRVLARPCGAGPSALAARREEPRAAVVGLRHLALRGHPDDPRGLELLRRATRSEPRSRSSASTSPS